MMGFTGFGDARSLWQPAKLLKGEHRWYIA